MHYNLIGSKATVSNSIELGKIMAVMPFKFVQGHSFWYELKAHMRLPISDCLILSYLLTSYLSSFTRYLSNLHPQHRVLLFNM